MRWLRPFLGGAVIAVLLSSLASVTHAANEIATRVSITPLEVLTVGSEASVLVALAQEDGAPVVDEPIALTIDGDSRPRRWTDESGVASFNLPRDLLPGEHEVVATYAGRTNAFLGASARTVVEIVPYELAIETVPPLPGMVFEIDGTRFEAGADGVARVGLDRLGEHTVNALPAEYQHPGEQIEFSRWSNETFGPTITVRTPLEVSLQAGFDVSYRASLDFRDTNGDRVDEERIEAVTLRNSIGAELKLGDGRSRWYKAVRTIRRPGGLDTVPIRYTVEEVVVDGVNVVNVGQQRFDVEPDSSWPIELLLYSVRLVPNDALFGYPLGDAVILTYPSGATTRIEAVDGEIAAHGLARGLYRVQLADAPGWSPVTPIALSRDQEVRVRVITYVDVGVVVILGLALALGLLHVGRPHLAQTALAGAKGVVAVTRNPRLIGAAARRPAGAGPLVASAREFDLQRADQPSSVPGSRAIGLPEETSSADGAVPIGQVIRMTLGSPLPASRAEASALPPPPPSLSALPPAPVVATPTRLVLAPSIAVADTQVPRAGQAEPRVAVSAAIGKRRAPSSSPPTGDGRRQPTRVRSGERATAAEQPSKKARRTKDEGSGSASSVAGVANQKRRRSPRASPDAWSVAESGKEPRTTPPTRGVSAKRSKAASTATMDQPKPRKAAARARARSSGREEPPAVEEKQGAAHPQEPSPRQTAKPRRRARATTDVADAGSMKAEAPKAAGAKRSAKAVAPKAGTKRSAKAEAPKAAGTKRSAKAVTPKAVTPKAVTPKAAGTKRSAKAVAPKAAGTKRSAKAVAPKAAKRSAKAVAPKAGTKRSAKAVAPKTAGAKRSAKAPSGKAASPPDVTATTDGREVAVLAVRDTTPSSAEAQQPSDPFGVRGDPADIVAAPVRISLAPALKPADESGVTATTPEAGEVGALASVASLLPRRLWRPDRPSSPPPTDTECTGCGGVLTPGARFCRRCGRATAAGEREREGLS